MILTDEEIERLGGAAFDDHAYKGTRVMNAELARAIEAAVLDKLREQEPVAWMNDVGNTITWDKLYPDMIPLYTHPAPEATVNAQLLQALKGYHRNSTSSDWSEDVWLAACAAIKAAEESL